jgi:proteasome accessory factor PafA2
MTRVFGLETEYGITINGAESVDVVAESIELVRSCPRPGVSMSWNYALEDPHRDARGFRAAQLLQDTDESAFFEVDRKRPLSFEEIKSDIALENGARFYNDHAHPEYSTPECTTLRQLVAQDKAGERILAECASRRSEKLPAGQAVQLYKNNTDFSGHSYGCHENYLMRRDVPWERIVSGVIPFFVTRQIFAGAGKLGLEAESASGEPGVYQISQRADFFRVIQSVDTMNKRPLVNTRDEPHADPAKYRRLHVIIGDSNMSEWATAVKVGTTALVLELIERGLAPELEIGRPVEALKAISRDPDYRWIIELKDGRKISAIDVQRLYLEAAKRADLSNDAETSWLLDEWETALHDLERDISFMGDRVDWVAKKRLLTALQEEEGLSWSDPWLQAIDLEYHKIAPDEGLFHELETQGSVRRLVSEDEIEEALVRPPATTRASFRGAAVARFRDAIHSIQWDEVVFKTNAGAQRVSLREPLLDARLEKLNAAVVDSDKVATLLNALTNLE